jgi:Na+/H+ antiporter NhaC
VPPVLTIDLAQSPIPAGPEDLERYRKLGDEWAAGHPADAPDLPAPAAALWVRVGEQGVRATLTDNTGRVQAFERPLPTRWSLLPAALAIVIAILAQRVLPALLAAGLAGSMAWSFARLEPASTLGRLADAVSHFLGDCLWRRAIWEDFYLRITVFVLMLFAAVAIIREGGGFRGLVALLQRRVRGPVGAQAATYVTGLVLMFDDYTNCLVTGTALRPLCDAMRVSRAKLAYLVDSTAAPIAGVSLASTWIAYEISQYRAPLALIARDDGTRYTSDDAMAVFLASMPFRYYCWFALLLAALVIVLRRDFGPMLAAERAARGTAGLPTHPPVGITPAAKEAPADVSQRGPAALAIVPIGAMVVTVAAMLSWGHPNDLALLAASSLALGLAVALGMRLGGLPITKMAAVAWQAVRSLGVPMLVLFLAWTLGHVTADLGTSHYLTAAARSYLLPAALPIALFMLAALIAFATGTSFGTMAILLPNVVLLAHELGRNGAFVGGGDLLLFLSIAAVLEGSIFGDHASPISDTTLLSALSSGCNNVEHFVTQLPYALCALATSVLFGYLPVLVFGPSAWLPGLVLGIVAMAGLLLTFGKRSG